MEYGKKILVGSNVFFNKFDDFKSKDKDYIIFEKEGNGYKFRKEVLMGGVDIFHFIFTSKDDFLSKTLEFEKPILFGKLLVPEVAVIIRLTIDDLKQFESGFRNVDLKHQYQNIIYDSYIENGSFSLTEEQLNTAYQSYKESRKE